MGGDGYRSDVEWMNEMKLRGALRPDGVGGYYALAKFGDYPSFALGIGSHQHPGPNAAPTPEETKLAPNHLGRSAGRTQRFGNTGKGRTHSTHKET